MCCDKYPVIKCLFIHVLPMITNKVCLNDIFPILTGKRKNVAAKLGLQLGPSQLAEHSTN